jgi:hypothetical protein
LNSRPWVLFSSFRPFWMDPRDGFEAGTKATPIPVVYWPYTISITQCSLRFRFCLISATCRTLRPTSQLIDHHIVILALRSQPLRLSDNTTCWLSHSCSARLVDRTCRYPPQKPRREQMHLRVKVEDTA